MYYVFVCTFVLRVFLVLPRSKSFCTHMKQGWRTYHNLNLFTMNYTLNHTRTHTHTHTHTRKQTNPHAPIQIRPQYTHTQTHTHTHTQLQAPCNINVSMEGYFKSVCGTHILTHTHSHKSQTHCTQTLSYAHTYTHTHTQPHTLSHVVASTE